MELVFLQAATPLTKQFTKAKDGTITKTPYPFVWEFTSIKEKCASLSDLKTLLERHAAASHCLLKGTINRDLQNESRAGSTDTNAATEFAVLDLDGLPDHVTIDALLDQLGIKDISYVVQWSASYGISDKKLRAHVFFMLDKPTAAPLLKQWLIHLNHTTQLLRDSMSLTKTGNSISWPLDISACQNDKLIYIAPPVLKGLKDPLKGARIALVTKKHHRLTIHGGFSSEKNRDLTHKRIAELREAEGLPKRKFTYKLKGRTEIMVKPDSCVITEMKQERGFVYFNLNGGDSWAYYHPENNPEFIFNFKGEPNYLTKELLPDYWNQLSSQATRVGSNGLIYLAFCDRATSSYWRGTYDPAQDELDLYAAKNETMLRHFALQNGMPLGEYIPEWDLVFDPHSTTRVDLQNQVVNRFKPSEYMKALPPAKAVTAVPKTIRKVIHHALGSDDAIYEHFINWLAYIVQQRDRTRTAWVLHGVSGTGKGLITTNILRPLFGPAHTTSRRMEELNEQYNGYMQHSFIVAVDEVQTKALNNERGVIAKLKNFITEEFIQIRSMYQNAYEARNYTNWIFNSNMPDPVTIDKHDRRFNVGKYQPEKLQITAKEVDQLANEVQDFYYYLAYSHQVDLDAAGTVLDTEDRRTMISISETSLDTAADAVLNGNFEFFMDQLPGPGGYPSNFAAQNALENYKATLRTIIERSAAYTNGRCNLSREELRNLLDYVVGQMPNTPNKFTSLLKHHRIHIEKVWIDDKAVSGIKVMWKDHADFAKHAEVLTPAVAKTPNPKAPASPPAVIPKATKKNQATPARKTVH